MSEIIHSPLVATVLVFALIAFGEWLSIVSRARVPMLLTAMVGFMILTWTGIFPENILESSQFAALGAILIGPAIVHMGTLIPMKVLREQYRAVVISLAGVVVAAILIFTIIPFVFNFETAVAGMGPISGGVVAMIITTEKLKELDLGTVALIPALIVAFQGLIGMPLALNFMRSYAKRLLGKIDDGTFTPMNAQLVEELEETKKLGPVRSSMTIRLFLVFVVGALGVVLGSITPINYSIWCLVFGIIGAKIGFLEQESLVKANSFTLTLVGIMFVVIGSMAGVSPQDVMKQLPAVAAIIILGTAGIALGGYVGAKLVKWDPLKGMPVALTALFGFPGDYLLCEEVARSTARTKDEEKLIFNELLTPMLIGGFTTVTVASVFIAGILVSFL
ncbi:hypothetical protein SAMN04488127_0665 [Bhargavaea ginsengi]|uniref:Na+/glutamate symporter n=1 Tax=Bhargavaea ginsengi TaxID=426757 RepID=A0A1H6UFK6_9BACL|nr:hypothetical protein [Bhargavaea ginsengi]SEI86950.1 hypothetical protein SAMN04488127_0665 [Bhargavaea ginsengi]